MPDDAQLDSLKLPPHSLEAEQSVLGELLLDVRREPCDRDLGNLAHDETLAKELKVPVVALSQLNRSLEQRPNKRPVMSDCANPGRSNRTRA